MEEKNFDVDVGGYAPTIMISNIVSAASKLNATTAEIDSIGSNLEKLPDRELYILAHSEQILENYCKERSFHLSIVKPYAEFVLDSRTKQKETRFKYFATSVGFCALVVSIIGLTIRYYYSY